MTDFPALVPVAGENERQQTDRELRNTAYEILEVCRAIRDLLQARL